MGKWHKISFCYLPCEQGPMSFPPHLYCILTFYRYCWWGVFHLCCTLEFIFSISAHKHILFLAILEHPPQTSSAFITVMFLQTTASYFRLFFLHPDNSAACSFSHENVPTGLIFFFFFPILILSEASPACSFCSSSPAPLTWCSNRGLLWR